MIDEIDLPKARERSCEHVGDNCKSSKGQMLDGEVLGNLHGAVEKKLSADSK